MVQRKIQRQQKKANWRERGIGVGEQVMRVRTYSMYEACAYAVREGSNEGQRSARSVYTSD